MLTRATSWSSLDTHLKNKYSECQKSETSRRESTHDMIQS